LPISHWKTDIKEGKIVPVEITVKLLLAAMHKCETKKFLIDGFPRSMNNYEVRAPRFVSSFFPSKFLRIHGMFVCLEQGWLSVVGDQADVAFCLLYDCPEEELERR
jgi:UMP-CMP kinase